MSILRTVADAIYGPGCTRHFSFRPRAPGKGRIALAHAIGQIDQLGDALSLSDTSRLIMTFACLQPDKRW